MKELFTVTGILGPIDLLNKIVNTNGQLLTQKLNHWGVLNNEVMKTSSFCNDRNKDKGVSKISSSSEG